MGIPAAFRWLSNKYPKIITPVVEDQPVTLDDGSTIPVDTTRPNPNDEEFDNLYLDMNGIVHPCSHPEDKPAPKDEEEMMLEIFNYTERVVSMVRPRKLLMIAVDGVAPRAKMNQQRSRRFRSAQEAKEKEADKQELLKLLRKQNGGSLPPGVATTGEKKAFDSNSITPGTPFMDVLAASLRYWCAYKLNTDRAWAGMKVIISDATVPGEGEHKIMNFIRSQRASADHDPNTRHVIYGLDADLIMLGLATHEPHFRVLREDVFAQDAKVKVCQLCGQKGHEARVCTGESKGKAGEHDEKDKKAPPKPFIWLHVSVLREYLAVELNVPGLPFPFDLERAIDDWIFMCCFVGNDFLPHLPALEIRENGIDTLTAIWRDSLPYMGGYVTKDGHIDLGRAQFILDGLARQEDAIFRRRKDVEDRREANAKRRRLQNGDQKHQREGPGVVQLAEAPGVITHDMIMNRGAGNQHANIANKSAASVIRGQIQGLTSNGGPAARDDSSVLGKRKEPPSGGGNGEARAGPSQNFKGGESSGESPPDLVRLWEDGYADRYYEQKFHVSPEDVEFRRQVARSYVEGLAWVLLYYFQGCPSWEWYYPYHYAPFAADFAGLGGMKISFEKGRIARPFEQLMSVLPAASRHALPEAFHDLMTREDSEVIDFYPEDFVIDLNGKKMAWQGVALLPFIDMPRLLDAVESKYPLLSAEDAARNGVGRDVLLISEVNQDMYDQVVSKIYSKKQGQALVDLDPRLSKGLSGRVSKQDDYTPHGSLNYPLESQAMPDIDFDQSLSVYYQMPTAPQAHKSMLLRGARLPDRVLTQSDVEELRGKMSNSGRAYGSAPFRRDHDYSRRGGRGGPTRHGFGHPHSRPPAPGYGGGAGGSRYGHGHSSGYPNIGSYSLPMEPQAPAIGWAQQSISRASESLAVPLPPPPPPVHFQQNRGYGNSLNSQARDGGQHQHSGGRSWPGEPRQGDSYAPTGGQRHDGPRRRRDFRR